MTTLAAIEAKGPPRVVIVHEGDRIDVEWTHCDTPQRQALMAYALDYAKWRLLYETCDFMKLEPVKEPL